MPCSRGVLCFVLAAALTAVAPVRSQVLNGGFESGSGSSIANWTFSGTTAQGSATIVTRSANGNLVDTGNQAVKVLSSAANLELVSARVSVSPSTRYRFTVRLRAGKKDIQGALRVAEWGASNNLLGTTSLATSSGISLNWETLRGYLLTGPQTQTVEVHLRSVQAIGSSQEAWDSVEMSRDDATAGEPWETALTSGTDYSASGNPYKDLLVTATFYQTTGTSCPAPPAPCSGTSCFQGYGFWDGVPGSSGTAFKVRALLPAGSWCWATSCASPTGLLSCGGDTGLNRQSAQPVTVLANVTPGNKLYALGMPRVSTADPRSLAYGDGTTSLPWIADTAWEAPLLYTAPSSGVPSADLWRSYVWDRATKGFTGVLVALAPEYVAQLQPNNAGFHQRAGCSPTNGTVIPNECTYWDAPYWQAFDQRVKDANDAGLIVVVAGLIDPKDRSGSNTNLPGTSTHLSFPAVDTATIFARNLAARLANRYVIFSPAFDDRVGDATVDGKTARDSMEAVGAALRSGKPPLSPIAAVPKHLVINHLAGGSPLDNYDSFQTGQDNWLSFQLFQSGHGGNKDGANTQCPSYLDGLSYAICRARDMSLHFRCLGDSLPICSQATPSSLTNPAPSAKAVANAEAAYEIFDSTAGPADNATGVRNTAYSSGLSGSAGFTLGIQGIVQWDNPSIFSDSYGSNQSKADNDLGRLAGLFRGGPWTALAPHHELVLNNTNSTPNLSRILLAGNYKYALVYVPAASATTSVSISTSQSVMSNLGCKTTWSFTWQDPTGAKASAAAPCSAGTNKITLSKPQACPTGLSTCDRVLVLTNNAFPQPSPITGNTLAVWTETTDSSTSSVLAQFIDDAGDAVGDPMVISQDDYTFAKLPTITQDPSGNYLVAWQTEYPDGTLDAISTQWLDPDGNLLGDPQQLDTATDGEQAEPALTTDWFGDVLLAWTGYSIDGEDAELVVEDMTARGLPTTGAPTVVSDPSQTEVSSAQIQSSAQGGSVVAWNATDRATRTPGVYFQRLNPHGKPVGPNRAVGHGSGVYRRLAWLAVAPNGHFRIRWESRSPSGTSLGYFEQQFDANGNEEGGETPVP